jgi:hypothetical protein
MAGCVGPLKERVISVADPERSVLIASRNSEFKNALVDAVVEQLAGEPWRIKITDITDLVVESADDYDVIVVVDRVWGGSISGIGSDFLEGVGPNKDKVILVATVHSPEWRPADADVDAVTAPSVASSPAALAADVAAMIRAHAQAADAP